MNLPINVRKVQIKRIKNVEFGSVSLIKGLNKSEQENLFGMYGQNGTGKTAFVNALQIIKTMLSDELSINLMPDKRKEIYDFLSIGTLKSQIIIDFDFSFNKINYSLRYDLLISKDEQKQYFVVNKEKLSFQSENDMGFIQYSLREKKYTSSLSIKENSLLENDLIVASKIAKINCSSYLFNNELIKEMHKKFPTNMLLVILNSLQTYARMYMFIITNKEYGMINLQWSLPFMFLFQTITKKDQVKIERIISGNQAINLKTSQPVTLDFYNKLNESIENINDIMNRIIPDTKIDIDKKDVVLANGTNGYNIDLVTIRNKKRIPMRNESTGILKIISIIQTLITYCTFDNIFVVIDELDSGIFEHLLGKLLEVLKAQGKGQLFFTSHNLRPLEVLDYKNIFFSTTNPQNRYIKLTNVKTNNNLRTFYLRALELGGQKEELYSEDDILGLKVALKRIAYAKKSI